MCWKGKRYLRHLKDFTTGPTNKVMMNTMASTAPAGLPILPAAARIPIGGASVFAPACTGAPCRRRIDPKAGHALEILGHAIEYLTDEFVHGGGEFSAHNAQLEAVQLLMALNREIYFACPRVPSVGERFLSLIGVHSA